MIQYYWYWIFNLQLRKRLIKIHKQLFLSLLNTTQHTYIQGQLTSWPPTSWQYVKDIYISTKSNEPNLFCHLSQTVEKFQLQVLRGIIQPLNFTLISQTWLQVYYTLLLWRYTCHHCMFLLSDTGCLCDNVTMGNIWSRAGNLSLSKNYMSSLHKVKSFCKLTLVARIIWPAAGS